MLYWQRKDTTKKSSSKVSFFLYTSQHYLGYPTLGPATPAASSIRVFTSDLFCARGTLRSFGPGEARAIAQHVQVIRVKTSLISLPCYCFFPPLQPWESYVLILHTFQEKHIPKRSFHVCHIMEDFLPAALAGSQLSQQNSRATCSFAWEGK